MDRLLLFDGDSRYTDTAMQIDQEFFAAIKPVFDRWAAEGYSVREISHLALLAVMDAELFKVLEDSDIKTPKKE